MIAAIVQARVGSRRLPGKTLADICGRPLLVHVIERIRPSRWVEEIVVATTDALEDRPVLDLARPCGAVGVAGSVDDVLDRYYRAARAVSADLVLRVTADDPFRDPVLMDRVVGALQTDDTLDYAATDSTFPEGAGCEAFTFSALEKAWRRARLPSEREHVTPYILNHPEQFKTQIIAGDRDLSRYRWTVDYPADLRFAREIYARLYRPGRVFGMEALLALLEKEPHLCEINQGIARNEGYARSLAQDADSLKGASKPQCPERIP